jgi:hypothetical protein
LAACGLIRLFVKDCVRHRRASQPVVQPHDVRCSLGDTPGLGYLILSTAAALPETPHLVPQRRHDSSEAQIKGLSYALSRAPITLMLPSLY